MSINKILVFILYTFCNTASAQNNLDDFGDSIVNLVFKGYTRIYDSLGNELVIDRFYHRMENEILEFSYFDGTYFNEGEIGDPVDKYVLTLRYGRLPGYLRSGVKQGIYTILDSAEAKDYYVFYESKIDGSTGALIHKKFAFAVKKSGEQINRESIFKAATKRYYDINPVERSIYQYLSMNNSQWRYKNIKYINEETVIDCCQNTYYIKLGNDNRFEQGYYKAQLIGEPKGEKMLRSGIIPYHIYGYTYSDTIPCFCFIETDKGLWQVKDNKLILYTTSGVEMMRYKIMNVGDNTLQLQSGDIVVTLIKELK